MPVVASDTGPSVVSPLDPNDFSSPTRAPSGFSIRTVPDLNVDSVSTSEISSLAVPEKVIRAFWPAALVVMTCDSPPLDGVIVPVIGEYAVSFNEPVFRPAGLTATWYVPVVESVTAPMNPFEVNDFSLKSSPLGLNHSSQTVWLNENSLTFSDTSSPAVPDIVYSAF